MCYMITVIAAVAENNAIGKNNDLIWSLSADLKRFKKVTTGHYILMGRNTFESIGRPLPNRTTIIITRNKSYFKEGCLIASSLEKAIELAKEEKEIFIIGGAQIYKETMAKNLADRLDVTLVHEAFDADVYFPKIDAKVWKETKREAFKADEKNEFDYNTRHGFFGLLTMAIILLRDFLKDSNISRLTRRIPTLTF